MELSRKYLEMSYMTNLLLHMSKENTAPAFHNYLHPYEMFSAETDW